MKMSLSPEEHRKVILKRILICVTSLISVSVIALVAIKLVGKEDKRITESFSSLEQVSDVVTQHENIENNNKNDSDEKISATDPNSEEETKNNSENSSDLSSEDKKPKNLNELKETIATYESSPMSNSDDFFNSPSSYFLNIESEDYFDVYNTIYEKTNGNIDKVSYFQALVESFFNSDIDGTSNLTSIKEYYQNKTLPSNSNDIFCNTIDGELYVSGACLYAPYYMWQKLNDGAVACSIGEMKEKLISMSYSEVSSIIDTGNSSYAQKIPMHEALIVLGKHYDLSNFELNFEYSLPINVSKDFWNREYAQCSYVIPVHDYQADFYGFLGFDSNNNFMGIYLQ